MLNWKILTLFAVLICVQSKEVTVTIPSLGMLTGQVFDDFQSFLNIPYIEPPVGVLRWKNPVEKKPWSGVLNATSYGPGCPQSCYLPESACPIVIDEDCIQLNIFTPKNVTDKKPVMVFFPGGDFQQGTAGFALYDGRFFVKRGDVVVVTVNYRLGPLGFLGTEKTLTGNYGLLDQIEALKFVQKNIHVFGGDPNQVTIFGQSAGGCSVATHLVSPLSKGLFHKAIIQSDPFTLPFKTAETAKSEGDYFLQQTKCDDNMECLQALSIEEITKAEIAVNKNLDYFAPLDLFLPWAPIIGSDLISDNPMTLIAKGEFTKVPVMLGAVENECRPFIWKASKSPINTAEYVAVAGYIFGLHGPGILERYPPTPFIGDKRGALSNMGSDFIFKCSARNAAQNFYHHMQENGVYFYHYDHSASFDIWGTNYSECVGYVCHGADLLLGWGTPPLVGYKFTPEEQTLSNLMLDYWTNFATTGNPNKGNQQVPTWPEYDKDLLNMRFHIPSYVEADWRKSQCDYFDSIGYRHGW